LIMEKFGKIGGGGTGIRVIRRVPCFGIVDFTVGKSADQAVGQGCVEIGGVKCRIVRDDTTRL
jgi:hypothetical protein